MSEAIVKRPVVTGKLSVGTKLGFGVCDLGGNLFFTALGFYAMIYLTDTVGIPAVVAGAVIMIGKLCDAVWDPVLGYLSDRTRTKWGRRRPYMFIGSVPLFLAMWFFFTNPRIADPKLLVAWGAFAFILLNMIYSVVNIPYSSLTPELTKDYNERSSLNGYRFMFAVVGTLLGAVAVNPIISSFGGGPGLDSGRGYSMVGLFFALIMLVTAMITSLTVREPGQGRQTKAEKGFFKAYLTVFRNKPFVIVLFGYMLHLIGLTFLQTSIPYYFNYLYKDWPGVKNAEALQTPAMGLLLVVAMIFIPISVLVSKRVGKKLTWQICFFILGTSSLAIFFLGHVLGPYFFIAMMVYAGIGVGFGYVAPYAMVPDTIEVDVIRTGKRNEGAFYGMYLFMSKIGQAIAWGVGLLVLALGRYVANIHPLPASAQLAIRFLVGPLPAIVLLVALILVQFYPLDEKSYLAIIEKEAGPTGG
jgi:glycoside/pentoside/hexuronide:cation symporter, GPH family